MTTSYITPDILQGRTTYEIAQQSAKLSALKVQIAQGDHEMTHLTADLAATVAMLQTVQQRRASRFVFVEQLQHYLTTLHLTAHEELLLDGAEAP